MTSVRLRSRQAEQRGSCEPVGEARVRRAGGPPELERQHGQVVPLAAVVLTLVGLLAAGVAHLGSRVVVRARAQSAADAAALGAAVAPDPRQVAQRVAAGNGATVTSLRLVGAVVVVTVRIDGTAATAAAAPRPFSVAPGDRP